MISLNKLGLASSSSFIPTSDSSSNAAGSVSCGVDLPSSEVRKKAKEIIDALTAFCGQKKLDKKKKIAGIAFGTVNDWAIQVKNLDKNPSAQKDSVVGKAIKIALEHFKLPGQEAKLARLRDRKAALENGENAENAPGPTNDSASELASESRTDERQEEPESVHKTTKQIDPEQKAKKIIAALTAYCSQKNGPKDKEIGGVPRKTVDGWVTQIQSLKQNPQIQKDTEHFKAIRIALEHFDVPERSAERDFLLPSQTKKEKIEEKSKKIIRALTAYCSQKELPEYKRIYDVPSGTVDRWVRQFRTLKKGPNDPENQKDLALHKALRIALAHFEAPEKAAELKVLVEGSKAIRNESAEPTSGSVSEKKPLHLPEDPKEASEIIIESFTDYADPNPDRKYGPFGGKPVNTTLMWLKHFRECHENVAVKPYRSQEAIKLVVEHFKAPERSKQLHTLLYGKMAEAAKRRKKRIAMPVSLKQTKRKFLPLRQLL